MLIKRVELAWQAKSPALPPLSIVGFYVTDRGDKALERTVGSHFKMIADSKAGQISQFINDVVIAMGGLAAAPVVREEATTADQVYRAGRSSSVDSRTRASRALP